MQQLNTLVSISKKVGLVVFAATYLLFAIGVFKSTHYCMGRPLSVVVFSSESKKCSCEIYEQEADRCCDDEKELIQIDDDHQPGLTYNLGIPHIYILGDLYTERFVADAETSGPTEQRGIAQPPVIPIYKRNCSIVFYESRA